MKLFFSQRAFLDFCNENKSFWLSFFSVCFGVFWICLFGFGCFFPAERLRLFWVLWSVQISELGKPRRKRAEPSRNYIAPFTLHEHKTACDGWRGGERVGSMVVVETRILMRPHQIDMFADFSRGNFQRTLQHLLRRNVLCSPLNWNENFMTFYCFVTDINNLFIMYPRSRPCCVVHINFYWATRKNESFQKKKAASTTNTWDCDFFSMPTSRKKFNFGSLEWE